MWTVFQKSLSTGHEEDHIHIDPYPGISAEHILQIGKNTPELTLFYGAIGQAYHRLYQPLLAYKDELKMLTKYEITDGTSPADQDAQIRSLEAEILRLKDKVSCYEKAQ